MHASVCVSVGSCIPVPGLCCVRATLDSGRRSSQATPAVLYQACVLLQGGYALINISQHTYREAQAESNCMATARSQSFSELSELPSLALKDPSSSQCTA